MHQLTIDPNRCHQPTNCHACEILVPGLVAYCQRHKRLFVSDPSTYTQSSTISALIATCPTRAIQITPIEEVHHARNHHPA